MFSDFVGDFLALAWCKLVQLLHFTKKPKGGKACIYAGLCGGCTSLHVALVPPTGIENGVVIGFFRNFSAKLARRPLAEPRKKAHHLCRRWA
jgi:hypothetical protein